MHRTGARPRQCRGAALPVCLLPTRAAKRRHRRREAARTPGLSPSHIPSHDPSAASCQGRASPHGSSLARCSSGRADARQGTGHVVTASGQRSRLLCCLASSPHPLGRFCRHDRPRTGHLRYFDDARQLAPWLRPPSRLETPSRRLAASPQARFPLLLGALAPGTAEARRSALPSAAVGHAFGLCRLGRPLVVRSSRQWRALAPSRWHANRVDALRQRNHVLCSEVLRQSCNGPTEGMGRSWPLVGRSSPRSSWPRC